MLSSPPARLLFILHGAIGDVVRALPLATRIRENWPSTKIFWAVEPKSADILADHPAIDQRIIFQRGRGNSEFRRFLREVRKVEADVALDLQRHLKSGWVSRATGAKLRLGFHRRNSKEGNWLFNNHHLPFFPDTLPKIWHYQKFGDFLGLPPIENLDFGLRFPGEIATESESLLRTACDERNVPLPEPSRRVALLIGGSWKSKLWNPFAFATLARRVTEELGALPILLGGRDDVQLAESIIRTLPNLECVSLAGRTNLRQLAYLLTQVRSAVSSDSGPMHIAAAVGTPVVSLWGPTDPRRTGPYRNEQNIVQTSIGCSPCYRRACPGLGTLCMSDIPHEIVFFRLRTIHES